MRDEEIEGQLLTPQKRTRLMWEISTTEEKKSTQKEKKNKKKKQKLQEEEQADMSAEKKKKNKKKEKRQAFSVEPSENHVIAAEMREWEKRKTLQGCHSSASTEKREKEKQILEVAGAENQQKEDIYSTEKRERKGKQKKQQKLGASQADIASEDPQKDAGKQLWEGSHVLTLTDKREKEKKKKKKNQKFDTSDVEGEAEKKEKKQKFEAIEEKSKKSKENSHVSADAITAVLIAPLELLKVIRDREISPQRKIQLTFDFVQSTQRRSTPGQGGFFSEKGLISPSHFVTSLSEWVQTQISSASKAYTLHPVTNAKLKGANTSLIGERPAHLDERYWTVFRWCLLSGMEWKAGFLSLNIMQALSCILDEASIVLSRDGTIFSSVNQTDLDNGTWSFTSAFFVVLLDVIKLLFHVYEGSFRPKLDMWISCTRSSLKLASRVYPCTGQMDVSTEGPRALLQLLLLLCRGFVRFLKSSPNPRKVFQAVVEKLLESLLTLFTGHSMKESGSHGAEMKDLLIGIESILKHSLFHPFHMDGYTSVCKVSQQASELCNDAITTELNVCKEAATVESNKLHRIGKATHVLPALLSYQKLLFQKLDYFVKERKVSILGSVAWILRTYIQESKGQAVSRSSTFLGVKSKHSKRPVHGENLAVDSGLDKIQVKDSRSSSFFAMFAELLFPLLKQLELLVSLCPLDKNFEASTLSYAKCVLDAVNSLLEVAKAEQVYVPTEDTPSLSHLSFMKHLYNKFIQLSTFLSEICSEVVSRHAKAQWSEEAQCLLLAVVNEVSLGIGHIMELEYRVLENDLQSIWELILFGATLHSTIGKNQKKAVDDAETAATLASSVMKIFGELRQVDLPLFSLCCFLRKLMIIEQAPSMCFVVKLQCNALMSTYLSQKVLSTLATVMKEAPEGQLASFLKLLKSDMEGTLEVVQKLVVLHRDNGCQMHQAGMKVLMEIYLCILEHGNVTALNSIQVGMSLRALMDVIICPSLVCLVDSAVSDGNILADFLSVANWENKTENMNQCSLEDKEDQLYKATTAGSKDDIPIIVLLIWEYIMRLYMSVKMLHRQCISLMPQKQARRACTAINDHRMLGLIAEATHGDHSIHKEGFFSCIKKGNVSIFKFLCRIEDWLQGTGHKNVDSFLYTLDCIAVHSLSDVKRQLKAVSFLLNQADQPGFEMNQCKEGAEEQSAFDAAGIEMLNEVDRKKMQKIHKKLRREASSLARFLTRWIRSLDFDRKYLKERDRSVKLSAREGEALVCLNMGWNKVICSLNRQTLPVARWDLLCQSIDVWSELASEEDAIAFCRFMFGKTLRLEDEQINCQSSSCTVYSVTSNLLECGIFYEQQAIRGVFLQALCQELLQRLSLSKMNITVNSSLQYIEGQVCNAQEFLGMGCGSRTKIQHIEIEQLEEFTSSFFDCDSTEITKCVLTIKLVSKAPEGYIKASSAATFISYIAKLESCVVVWLLNSRERLLNADESCSRIDFSKLLVGLELLLACRRSIESLLLQEGSLDCTLQDSCIITALLQDFGSMYWPVLSMHAVAICFDNFFNGLPDDAVLSSGKDMLFSYLKCTMGLFTFFSQRFFKELLNPLLLRSGNEQISSLNKVDLDDSLGAVMTTLVAQLKQCSKFIKVAKSDYLAGLSNKQSMEESFKKKDSTLQERSLGVFALLGAVGSILWSITATLELLDEKCHLDKSGNTKWSGELPGELLSWIQTVESFAIDSLHNILLADRLACVEMLGVDCSQDDDELLVSPDGEEENKRVKTCRKSIQKQLASASFDVKMEAFEGLADHEDQESGSHNYDMDVIEESDNDERDSGCFKNSCIKKLPEKESIIRNLSSPNVEERKHTSTQLFGDLPLMLYGQVSLVKVMLLGKWEMLSWLAGELFMAMAAIVRLKSLLHSPNVTNPSAGELLNQEWSSSMSFHVGTAITILQEAAKMPELKRFSSLIFLPGVIKYLESFGSFLPYTRPTLSPAAFVKLVNTQMVLLGAVLSKCQVTECLGSFEELTCCLQSCFNMLMKKPLGLHFHLALQTIERSLLGFQGSERRVCFGGMKTISSLLGGIECLTVILNAVSGFKRLQILSKYCSRYIAAIFNLIVTSQSSWHKLHESKGALYLTASFNPHDAAILIMKCVEILVTVSSREAIFPMKASHVAQAMSCPADLFKPFYQCNLQKEKLLQDIFAASERFDFSEYNAFILDDQILSLEIYVACCKLLRNLLRHRRRESGHCVALMGESVRALLFFLEVMENATSSRQHIKERGTQGTTECASWLRRVYEEVAEHRETLGSYVVHMLSDYICIISGYGMSIEGLSREVEATLRPGAYALLGICSVEDLQQLHAVLGEGPRRTTLTDMRRDYEKHFKYIGKV